MKILHLFLATSALFTSWVSTAHAAFNPAVVANDAQWVVYLDLNELRETVLGKELISLVRKQAKLPVGSSELGINVDKVLATVGSVTAYGANLIADPARIDGALVLQGTPDLRKIVEALVIQASLTSPKDVAEEKGLPFEAYRIGGEVLIAFPPEPIVLVSKAKAQLLKAHDVFRGTAPSLAKASQSPLTPLLVAANRAYLVAASTVPSDVNKLPEGPQTRIFQLMNAGSLTLGESGDKTTAHLELVSASTDMGTKLQKIVDGMTAVLSLAETTDRQLAEFLRSTTVARKDRNVTLDLAYPSERLVQMIHTLQEGGSRPAPRSAPPAPKQTLLAEWTLEGAAANTESLGSRKIENVHLSTGSTLVINSRHEGEVRETKLGRLDVVEISPAAGGAALRFEAENMRLNRYSSIPSTSASGKKMVALRSGTGSASFEFPGADGDYTVVVRYAQETDPSTKVSISAREPAVVESTP